MTIKKRNIKSAKSATSEKEHTYSIDSLHLADTVNTENDSVRGEEMPMGMTPNDSSRTSGYARQQTI